MEQSQPTAGAIPERAGQTTAERPWPLRVFSQKLKEYIDRAPTAWVEGQVIELKQRAGTSFITLRDMDQEMSLPLTVWESTMRSLTTPLDRGSHVVAEVKADFWTKTGRLGMKVRGIKAVGIGDLLARIEMLKQNLAKEGLFAPERKKRLPFLPQRIGLVTGRDSDAEKDVIRNATLRWPQVRFEVRNVLVQGPSSPEQVARAIQELDAMPEVDVIVVARGGGSLEDLLGFSDERLVRVAAACRTPLVSAIGHEADRPILDEVADLRASTPTDAAKRVVPDLAEEKERLAAARAYMRRSLEGLVRRESDLLRSYRSRPALAEPETALIQRSEDVERLRERMFRTITARVEGERVHVANQRSHVRALSPQKTLERGYAVVLTPDGSLVSSAQDAPAGSVVDVRLARGRLSAQVTASEAAPPAEAAESAHDES